MLTHGHESAQSKVGVGVGVGGGECVCVLADQCRLSKHGLSMVSCLLARPVPACRLSLQRPSCSLMTAYLSYQTALASLLILPIMACQ